jgi:MoaA/NifB/PqqE/SkfB family radical SAM enzyme
MIIPKQLIIETTSRCNLSCRFCPNTVLGEKGRDMDIDFFESIVERINFKTVVIPWMNGEPLLHPHYTQMIKYLTSRKLPCYITTNGMIWNEDLFNHITDPTSCYQLIFSLDGLLDSESSSIEKARPGSNRKKIKEHILKLIDLRDRKKSNLTVATKLCQRGQDWEEVESYIDFWLREGVDYVCIGRNLTDDNTPGMRTSPCQYFDNNFMVIRADGRLVACAYNDAVVNRGALPLGYLDSTTPLLEVYNNEAYQSLRDSQNRGEYPGPCKTCGFAYTGQGMTGVVKLRNKALLQSPIYFHKDYYNEFFSLTKRWKDESYYSRGAVL